MDLNLRGRVALITGGASGIGWATARSFASEGAHVALLDVSPEVTTRAADLATEFDIHTLGLPCDVTDERSVVSAVSLAVETLEGVDHVVHSAAIGSGKYGFPFTNLTPTDWPRVLEVNVMGMVHLAHAAVEGLKARGRGTMVFVASVAGQMGSQTDPPYSASKAANINFAQCLAKDLAKHQIRVNSVCPGMVKTPLNLGVWQAWHDQAPPEERLDYDTWAEAKIKQVCPLGTWQTPEDIADLIVFLSSDRARQITGQTMNVDGGFVMHW